MPTFSEGLGRFLRRRQPQAPKLGARELEVMKILWRGESLSAKQVLDDLPNCELSLSSMQSTLERLFRKSLLTREKLGRFYVYQAKVSRSELITLLLGDIAEQVSDGQMAPMISGFMAFIGEDNTSTTTDKLQKAIDQLPSTRDD